MVNELDQQTLINILFGAVSAGLSWFAREMWSAIKSIGDDLSELREEIASERVHKDDFKEALREVKDLLNKIADRLDHKADK